MATVHSFEYQMGFARAKAAVTRMGKYNLSPSIMDQQEYGYLWREFIAGWKAGLTAVAREDWESARRVS